MHGRTASSRTRTQDMPTVTPLDYAAGSRSTRPLRKVGRWIIVLLLLVLLYCLPWCFGAQIGLVKPCCNMRYYYFVEYDSRTDRLLYVLYWPIIRLSLRFETTWWGAHGAKHWLDRRPTPPLPEGVNGL